MAHDVFISHAHKDKGIADAICRKLESSRVRCWIAERDISAGEDWTETTRKAIGSSRVMVLVLSENANAAPHIERELAHAFYTKRIIIPLRLTKTLPRRNFLFYLGDVRWFDALSSPAEQDLEALTTAINGLVRRTTNNGAMHPHDLIKSTAPINFSNSWIGALQASHYRTLEILKRAAMAGSLIVVGCLLWFVFGQTKNGGSLAEGHRHVLSAGPGASADSPPQASGETSMSKPAYSYTRFGLWVANSSPTPSIQGGLQETHSGGGATPSPLPDIEQKAAPKPERSQVHDGAGARSMEGDPTRKMNRRAGTGAKSRTKSRNGRVRAAEESRFANSKHGLRAHWHRFAARIKEIANQ